MKRQIFIIEAGFTRSYYVPHTEKIFSPIQWEAKQYTNKGDASRAIYAMRFNPKVKEFRKQSIKLRVRPLGIEYIQLSLFEVNP